jgi:nitrile hydratase subunit beta
MNGVHDMGGMHGLGPIQAENEEPVFPERWEGRAFALTLSI